MSTRLARAPAAKVLICLVDFGPGVLHKRAFHLDGLPDRGAAIDQQDRGHVAVVGLQPSRATFDAALSAMAVLFAQGGLSSALPERRRSTEFVHSTGSRQRNLVGGLDDAWQRRRRTGQRIQGHLRGRRGRQTTRP